MSTPAPTPTATVTDRPTGVGPVLLAVAIVLVALNLRAAITSVPPLLVTLSEALHLGGAAAGLLTTLPVLCMGLFAPVAQVLARRYGRETTAAGALGLVLAGTAIRLAAGSVPVLYLSTLLAGAGIAVIGTVLPGVVKEYFASRSGLVTGLYMGGMMAGAALASQFSVPLATLLGSWQRSLAAWSVLALVATAAWLPVTAHGRRRHAEAAAAAATRQGLPWRSGTAWLLSAYILCNSWEFYTQLAWIPATYESLGHPASAAAALLTTFAVTQALSGIGGPALADRVRDRRMLLAPAVVLSAVGTAGVAFLPQASPVLWMIVLGLGLGAGFALGLVLLVDFAAGTAASERLTAMSFLVSYTLAAVGPVVFGALKDSTGGVRVPWIVLVVICLIQLCLVARLGPRRRPVA